MSVRKEFSSSDATLSAFAKVVEGFTKFSYRKSLEATKNLSGNNKLTSYSLGKEDEEASIEMYMTQLREWEKEAVSQKGVNDVTKLPPFAIACTHFNEDLEEVTDIVTVKITGFGRTIEGGADGSKQELQLLCLGIEFGKS